MLAASVAEYGPRGIRDVPVHSEDEYASARRQSTKVFHEGADLTPSMMVVDIPVSLGFRDEKLQTGFVAAGKDVGTVSTDKRRYGVTRSPEKIGRNASLRVTTPLYCLGSGNH